MGEQNFLRLNILALRICSMYPNRHNAGFFERFLYSSYKAISTISLYFALIPPFYELYLREKTSVALYAMDIVNFCIYVCTIVTIHVFHIRENAERKFVKKMNNLFKSNSTGLLEKDMTETNKITMGITIGFCALTTSIVVMMGFFPMFRKLEKRMLPISGRYPFNYTKSPYYEMIYVSQFHAHLLMGALTGAADSFFMCVVLTTAVQFELLANDFHNSVYSTLLKYGFTKENILNFIENSGNSEELLLKNYIEHHQKLLAFCMKMEQFFWPFIFMKTSVNMFYNIFIPFALLTSTNDARLAFILAQYELCALSELFIYSITGQAIITKCEELQEKLYNSPWYFTNKKHKVLVLMVLMRSRRPVQVSVAKLYDMSHGTFIMILKASMSYLAVLRQVID